MTMLLRYDKKGSKMRNGMTMIELIFAIVIIAISIISIPSIMAVATQASKGVTVDDDLLKRMLGETIKIFQTRWDGHYDPSDSKLLLMSPNTGDLHCSERIVGSGMLFRDNNDSIVQCRDSNDTNASPSMAATPPTGTGNLQSGIEQIHHFPNLVLEVNASGETYSVPITYEVSYVDSTISPSDSSSNTATATWRLGSSANMSPNSSGSQTHLKRVVAHCTPGNTNDVDVDIALTFFKSNKGN